jgi:Uri superfamily endonuclease
VRIEEIGAHMKRVMRHLCQQTVRLWIVALLQRSAFVSHVFVDTPEFGKNEKGLAGKPARPWEESLN